MRAGRLTTVFAALVMLGGCTAFNLAEHQTPLSVKKQRRAKDVVCVVKRFPYDPVEEDADVSVSEQDLVRWQQILVQGLDQSNIFAEVRAGAKGDSDEAADYVLEGKIKRFYFKKNWVPTFFPFHLGVSFFTLTLYTWLAGPTTVAMVDFEIQAELKDARSGATIGDFRERYKDTTPLNIYSKEVDNPYENPSLVFSQVIQSLAIRMSASLPS